ncbi:6-bladed beta-propeller [Belliella kenyensis]|uniref:6-bladed beta-propeller n=1 Tax=Belliella kenyensis TaxID=1472724 RepID=A0ABV8EPK9_9BACT|nr:6-bladed beta-propeller [Belliella kenyensis]MCH7400778.1 6-bladed beta-propeller [Belliella kenyensis]MDN3601934.1 6-bladed beta-propeller [Belliella kenyensis]
MAIRRKNYILIFALVWACNAPVSEDANHVSVIKLDPLLTSKKEKVNLSEIAESIEYIILETNEQSIFGHIVAPEEQIKFFEKGILISDKRKLLHFNYHGNFIGEIGKRGNGPTEYADIRDFAINPSLQQIAVLSPPNQRTFIYDYSGDGTKDFMVDFWPLHIASLGDDFVYIIPKGRRKPHGYHTLKFLSHNNSGNQELLIDYFDKKSSESVALSSNQRLYQIKDNELSFWEFHYDTIWRISPDRKITPAFYLDYEENKLPNKYLFDENVSQHEEKDQYVRLWGFVESERFFFFDMDNKNKLNRVYFDKMLHTGANLRFDRKGNGYHFEFHNDMDGGLHFWPDGEMGENRVFKLVYPHELLAHFSDENSAEKIGLSLHSMDKSDNPILMIVKLKD